MISYVINLLGLNSTNIHYMKQIYTPDEIRKEFAKKGLSISEWARSKGYSTSLVYQVLTGQKKALRGQSHRIAVSLGLKEGEHGDINDLPF